MAKQRKETQQKFTEIPDTERFVLIFIIFHLKLNIYVMNLFKLAERVSKYTKTVLVNNRKKLRRYLESPFHKTDAFLANEADDQGIHEIVMEQRTVTDEKPVHAGVCILQNSKLMLLRFVEFLRTYLVEGSYSLVYGGIIINLLLIHHKILFKTPIV